MKPSLKKIVCTHQLLPDPRGGARCVKLNSPETISIATGAYNLLTLGLFLQYISGVKLKADGQTPSRRAEAWRDSRVRAMVGDDARNKKFVVLAK